MQPQPHSTQIKHWADGAEIQYLSTRRNNEWIAPALNKPAWTPATRYRVKPDCEYALNYFKPHPNFQHLYTKYLEGHPLQFRYTDLEDIIPEDFWCDVPDSLEDPFDWFSSTLNEPIELRLKPQKIRKYMWNLISTTTSHPTPYMTCYCAEGESPTSQVSKPYKRWVKSEFYIEVDPD